MDRKYWTSGYTALYATVLGHYGGLHTFLGATQGFIWFPFGGLTSILILGVPIVSTGLVENNRSREVHPRRRKRQSGASIVEASVVLLPFMALFFALWDYGMALFMTNTMQFAVRQGVRYAVTSETMTGLGQDDSIKTTVSNNSFGFLTYLAPGSPGCTGTNCITINYYKPPDLTDVVTGTGSNASGNVVEVSASGLLYKWMIPLWRPSGNLTINVSSADIMESQPNGIPTR